MNYRKIWEKANGPIPLDEHGRSYEIHHIDGDRSNNSLENLVCISIEEHYRIHREQGDWGACHAIEVRMKPQTAFSGWNHSQKTKDKIRKTLSGRKNGPRPQYVKDKIAKAKKGKKQTKESILKMIESKRRNGTIKHTDEAKRKIAEASKGRKHTAESIQKMRQIKKDSRPTKEALQKSAEVRSKPIVHVEFGTIYKSGRDACRIFNWKPGKLAYRIKKGEFKYL